MAENDFLHSLLSKVTASKGDSGGQGKVDLFVCLLLSNKVFLWTLFSMAYILERVFVRAVSPQWRSVNFDGSEAA